MRNKCLCIFQRSRIFSTNPLYQQYFCPPKITGHFKFLSLFATVLTFVSSQELHLTNNITKHLNLASSLIQLPKHRCPLPVVMHQYILPVFCPAATQNEFCVCQPSTIVSKCPLLPPFFHITICP